MTTDNWNGVYAATLCPFHDDERVNESALREYIRDLISPKNGLNGVVPNGHTGEIMSLLPEERAYVTHIVAEAVEGRMKVISGVSAEGSLEAIAHARAARAAGADAILLMPPHHWLRFGRDRETAIGFVQDVTQGAEIPVILHQYPAWTKASYSLDEMKELASLPGVVAIKMGTRDMARWGHDYRELNACAPDVAILSCHDEYLLATLLDGCDGALVGFAGFVPELIVALTRAALSGDLSRAREIQEKVLPLARIVYRFGEPSGDAHRRMKCARWLLGQFPSHVVRKPLRPLKEAEISRIRTELQEAGYALNR